MLETGTDTVNNIELFSKMASSPSFLRRELESCFRKGFVSELSKTAEEEYSTFDPYQAQRKPTYKQFLKKMESENASRSGKQLNDVVTTEDTVRNTINLLRRADNELMESGSAPTKALAAAAFPVLEGFAQRKAVHLAMNQIKERAEEATEY